MELPNSAKVKKVLDEALIEEFGDDTRVSGSVSVLRRESGFKLTYEVTVNN